MSRCIDADALEELFREVIGGIAKKPEMKGNLEHMVRASAMVIEMIQDAPTIEPQRNKGRWIKITTGAMREKYMCSICGRTIQDDGIERLVRIRYPFCHCGAEMGDAVDTARDIVHEAIDNSVWSDAVDTAKIHKIVDDKYAEMTEGEG